MKYIVQCFLLSLLFQSFCAERVQAVERMDTRLLANQVAGIDSLDSIFFDLRTVQLTGGAFDFQVFIKSNDSVFAMDFSFKYDQSRLIYDTITGLQSYVSFLSNYLSFDSTVYFTSYTTANAYQNNTQLVKVRFFPLIGQTTMVLQDIRSALGYLNGDQCPLKVLVPSLTGLNEIPASRFRLYPNPAVETLKLEVEEELLVTITDLHGRMVQMPFLCTPGVVTTFQTGALPDGVYLINLQGANGRSAQSRVVVNR